MKGVLLGVIRNEDVTVVINGGVSARIPYQHSISQISRPCMYPSSRLVGLAQLLYI